MSQEVLEPLSQFGIGGLMGALWVWERWLSRRREQELSQAHERIIQEREAFGELVQLIRQNSHALERFDQTQQQLKTVLENLQNEVTGRLTAGGARP